ncbi:CBS domain-containing protein [Acidianus brierleyi]|uniref:Signal transduction protein n=1 Tax=Acidianus brierleyi TaxID=41673 RepID=A0A2U9IFA1_9CREN|nr:CBS domain-containing protein [Acidianus brierleyi]AWR94722.1 CBS domain-containing protein [Acidianus brierleyi]
MIEGSDIISLDCNSSVYDAIFFMKRRNIRRVVITCERNPLGLFTVDEALKQILYSTETKLKDIKLKDIIRVNSKDIREIVNAMILNNVDAVIIDNKIITEKDVVLSVNWGNDKISKISKDAITIESYSSMVTAIEIMLKHNIRHLPVLEKEPRGMLSARDIVYYYCDNLTLDSPVSQLMTPNLVNADNNLTLRDGVNLMKKYGIGSLFIRPKKIVTFKDFIVYIFNENQ